MHLVAPDATAEGVGGALTVRCGDGFLEQILDVLLSNAITATPSGGEVAVRVEADGVDGGVRVIVDDDGPGLDAESRERAFERFWRGAGRPRGSGSGLGLPIARRLARLASGDVMLDTAPGGGTRAVVTLRPPAGI